MNAAERGALAPVDFIKRLVGAWDCCATCAGGVLAQHDASVRAAALRDAADEVDAEWNRLDVWFRPIRSDRFNEGVLSGLERAENLLRARADREGR